MLACGNFLQDLQRFYHNVDLWGFKPLLLRYSNACLRLFVVILQDLHCLQRSHHNVYLWGVKLYHPTNFHVWWSFC